MKANCHILLYAASNVTKKALKEGQDVNFFDFFWCFPNYCIKMNGKMPRERGKVTKLVFWATLLAHTFECGARPAGSASGI